MCILKAISPFSSNFIILSVFINKQVQSTQYLNIYSTRHCTTISSVLVYVQPKGMQASIFQAGPWVQKYVGRFAQGRACGTASLSYRGQLRSTSSQRYEQPRTQLKFGERCFAFVGPAAWNSLPSSVQELTDTTAFKRELKTVLFQRCYSSSPSFN